MAHNKSISLWFDRALSSSILKQVLILCLLLTVVFLSSFILLYFTGPDWTKYCETHNINKWVFPLYLLIDGNAFNGFYADAEVSKISVLFAGILYIAGVIIFTGMLISVITNIIERRVEAHREGRLYYIQHGHYIIMGYDAMVPSFIKHIQTTDKNAYIILFTSADITDVTEKLRKSFTADEMKRIIVNFGHRTSTESYNDISLQSSKEIFIVGDHNNPNHDAINIECVDTICKYLNQIEETHRKLKKITCVFKDLDTYTAFKTTEIFKKVQELKIDFEPYNLYAGWAKRVLIKRDWSASHSEQASTNPNCLTKIAYPPVFGKGITPDDQHFVHLVFVGTSNFAVAFAMEAAHILHFPNFNHNNNLKTRITFIDINADKEKDEFITRNRHFFEIQYYRYQDLSSGSSEVQIVEPTSKHRLKNFLDIEFEFIKGDVFSTTVQDEISKWANDIENRHLSIFLTMGSQRSNFIMAMNMPDEIYDNNIPVFVRQDRSDNFVTNLRNADADIRPYARIIDGNVVTTPRSGRYANIYPFGMNESIYIADNKSLKRAKLINYLYFWDSLSMLEAKPTIEIWKEANAQWNEKKVAEKWSNLYNSYSIRTKYACLRAMRGLDINDFSRDYDELKEDEIEEFAMVEHNRWNVEKLLLGFRRPYDDEDLYLAKCEEDSITLKNNKNIFIHHDIRPFSELYLSSQNFDRKFTRYMPWIMKMTEVDTTTKPTNQK